MAGPQQVVLDTHLVTFLQSGVPIQVGTRDAFNKTTYSRSWACKVNDDRQSLILFMYRNYCAQALDNIRANGCYAAVFINVLNYETYQIKGSGAQILQDLTPYRTLIEHYQRSMESMVANIGLPPVAVDNMADRSMTDYVPVYCPIDACFRQTPGPGAGARISS